MQLLKSDTVLDNFLWQLNLCQGQKLKELYCHARFFVFNWPKEIHRHEQSSSFPLLNLPDSAFSCSATYIFHSKSEIEM